MLTKQMELNSDHNGIIVQFFLGYSHGYYTCDVIQGSITMLSTFFIIASNYCLSALRTPYALYVNK